MIWKDIKGYEGKYQISDLGVVKTIHKNYIKELKQQLNCKGYYTVCLSKNGKHKRFFVHRLVAIAFIGNPKKLPEVNHKNCIRHDNRVENLEWVSREDNNAYTSKMKHKSNKQIKCIESGEIFATSTEASKKNGGDSANIRKSARNNGRSSVYGFHYIYLEPLSFGELDAN